METKKEEQTKQEDAKPAPAKPKKSNKYKAPHLTKFDKLEKLILSGE